MNDGGGDPATHQSEKVLADMMMWVRFHFEETYRQLSVQPLSEERIEELANHCAALKRRMCSLWSMAGTRWYCVF